MFRDVTSTESVFAGHRGKHIRWSTFLKAHWKVFAASDFFSVEVWTPPSLVTYNVLFVIGIADLVVHVAGITSRPDEAWMLQVGRHLLDAEDGVLAGKRYLIVDRDTKYSKRFRDFIAEGGTEVIRLPPLSPNLNALAERFVRSINEECLAKMIFVGQGSLRRALTEYMTHFHEERNHQGLENRLIRERPVVAANDASIHRRTRLDGMLNCYHRVAA
jgi:putative transposase